MEQLLGEITYTNQKGFAFVIALDGTSVFLHYKEIQGKLVPRIGDLVIYSVRPSKVKLGCNEAFNARITRGADVTPVGMPATQGKVAQ